MTKVKFKADEVLGYDYFYNLFAKRKRLFPISYFFFKIKTRKHKVSVEKNLHRKIIKSYLSIYFNEFYHHDTPKYFPLSGLLKKVKGKGMFNNNKKITFGRSIIWLWYNRPGIAYVSNINLKKQKGSTSRVGILDENYKLNRDVNLLPNFKEEIKELKETNKMFKI